MKSQNTLIRECRRYIPLVVLVSSAAFWNATAARAEDPEIFSVNVLVKDAKSDEPIAFARLTLQYRQEGSKFKLKRGKTVSLSAKTNLQGRYKFVNIPKGTIRLMVIADRRQTFGQEIELDEDNQLIEVKLRKPQELL
ncbi:MAG: carboxypeptidase regulatory-like domain-containing protein [Acidobacteria bacterium]|nr:carboxypeptidase regulatory-like domain-containing protein [Acidobacteriota bacterium]